MKNKSFIIITAINIAALIILSSFFLASCTESKITMRLGSNVYDNICIIISGNTVVFPKDFNYLLDKQPEGFDYELELKGKIDSKEKVIRCNNQIEFVVFIYTKNILSIGYNGQEFNFVRVKDE